MRTRNLASAMPPETELFKSYGHSTDRSNEDLVSRRRTPSMQLISLLIAAVAGVIAVGQPSRGEGDVLQYESADCVPPTVGSVYFALGRSVFEWPEQELTMIGDLPSDRATDAAQPPDASAPEGCVSNPIQAASVSFLYQYEAIRADKYNPQYSQGVPEILRLFAVPTDYWLPQVAAERRFEETCGKWKLREPSPGGLVACYTPRKDGAPKPQWSVTYKAEGSIHTAPYGRPFVITCLYANAMTCSVTYKIFDDVNIAYEFSPSKIPLSSIVEFDLALRRRIEATRLLGYPWP